MHNLCYNGCSFEHTIKLYLSSEGGGGGNLEWNHELFFYAGTVVNHKTINNIDWM